MREKLQNKKGFTLAELLIVVAIIAVLVAVSIPVFTAKLESSRDAVSIANIRSAYAQAMTEVVTYSTDITSGDVQIVATKDAGGAITEYEVKIAKVVIKSQQADDWSGLAKELPWKQTTTTPADGGVPKTAATVTFTISPNGEVTACSYT